MNIHEQPDGTFELGDWPYRMNPDWVNINWIITHRCALGCPYCIGWKGMSGCPPTALDVHGLEGTLERLEKMRDSCGKEVYLTISGGEPTHEPLLPAMCSALAKRGFVIELQTNLTTDSFKAWADEMPPGQVAQVMASYHEWAFKKDPKLKERYLSNFSHAADLGLSPVAKRVVLPREASAPEAVLRSVQHDLPTGAPVLLWLYIKGKPQKPGDFATAYPYAYTNKQKVKLNAVRVYRRNCQRWYQEGAGFFRGMCCDAGRCFVYMDVKGRVWKCFTAGGKPAFQVGNLAQGTLSLDDRATPCPHGFCSTPFWGLWYGVNPWEYVPGMKRDGSTFCRNYPKES